MKDLLTGISRRAASFAVAALLSGVTTSAVFAAQWMASAGAQSPDLGRQTQAFLPNELWIHAGDSIRWTHVVDEIHTVTFLKPGQVRPANFGPAWGVPVGCPGNTPDGAAFDGTSCVNSGILGQGPVNLGPVIQTYSVTFPSTGNFKLVCLVHTDMTGTVHVLSPSETLPHNQDFYDRQAQREQSRLLADASRLGARGTPAGEDGVQGDVAAGIGEIVTTTGDGTAMVSVMRFQRETIVVRVGDTVTWTNLDPSANHTVTFGVEPADPRPATTTLPLASDGARQAVISSPADSVSSGFLTPAPQDRTNLAQSSPGITRFRVTFTSPGTFSYICAIHDQLGMKGTVIVQP